MFVIHPSKKLSSRAWRSLKMMSLLSSVKPSCSNNFTLIAVSAFSISSISALKRAFSALERDIQNSFLRVAWSLLWSIACVDSRIVVWNGPFNLFSKIQKLGFGPLFFGYSFGYSLFNNKRVATFLCDNEHVKDCF